MHRSQDLFIQFKDFLIQCDIWQHCKVHKFRILFSALGTCGIFSISINYWRWSSFIFGIFYRWYLFSYAHLLLCFVLHLFPVHTQVHKVMKNLIFHTPICLSTQSLVWICDSFIILIFKNHYLSALTSTRKHVTNSIHFGSSPPSNLSMSFLWLVSCCIL